MPASSSTSVATVNPSCAQRLGIAAFFAPMRKTSPGDLIATPPARRLLGVDPLLVVVRAEQPELRSPHQQKSSHNLLVAGRLVGDPNFGHGLKPWRSQ